MAAGHCEGTVLGVDKDTFDPEDGAKRLNKAMKGLGTDELQIIKVLTEHNNDQRQKIKETYKALFGKDLVEELKSELAGHFESLCLYLLMPTPHFDAFCLKNAMARMGTKESHLIDVLVSRNNEQVQAMARTYKELFRGDLEHDLKEEVSGDFQRVLIALKQGMRRTEEEDEVVEENAKADMRELYNAGEGLRLGTDEDTFTRVLVNRSPSHLRKVFELYNEYAQKDIEAAVIGEFSGDTQKAFLSIVRYIKNPLQFFASCFHESMKGPGTDDERLMQLVVSHAEVDLKDIAKTYKEQYKCSLAKAVDEDTSGDYRKLLLELVKTGDEDDVKK